MMAPFKRRKPADPLEARRRELEARLAEVRTQIERIADAEPPPSDPAQSPRFRSTAKPHGVHLPDPPDDLQLETAPRPPRRGNDPDEGEAFQFNELGLRKWDPFAVWRRWKRSLQGSGPHDSRFVRYMAAGGIQGLRPLRYERRIARNRFLLVFLILLLTLWGFAWILFSNS